MSEWEDVKCAPSKVSGEVNWNTPFYDGTQEMQVMIVANKGTLQSVQVYTTNNYSHHFLLSVYPNDLIE